MNLPVITHASDYRFAQTGHQTVHAKWISFGISGLIRSTVYFPDGKLCETFDYSKQKEIPYINFGYPGFRSDFEYDSTRENWVVIMEFDALKYDPAGHQLYLEDEGTFLPVPKSLSIDPAEVEPLRHTFRTITDLYRTQIPRNVLTAEMMLVPLIQRFLQKEQPMDDLVETFRKRMDADEKWERSLEEHCASLGCGRDSLRNEFIRRYGIAPGEYRIRKRLQKILTLFACTHMTFKEIAFEVGMRNATHLNRLLREHFNKTPTELCREYRVRRSKG